MSDPAFLAPDHVRVRFAPSPTGRLHVGNLRTALHNWLAAREEVKERLASLKESDLELVRVLEDVVSVLVEKGVIRYTDLPDAARRKLDRRAVTRAEIEGLSGLLGDDDHQLI